MKKIAILYSGGRYWGGIESMLIDLLSQKNNEAEFVLISMGEWELSKKLQDKVRIFNLSQARLNPFLPFQIKKILKKENIDYLVSQGVMANVYARKTALISKVKNVVIVPSNLRDEYRSFCKRNIFVLIDRLLRFKTTKFICTSKYLKDELIKSGVEGSKIDVVYNTIDEHKIIRKKPGKEVVVGSVGRLEKEKGYELLINTMLLLPENYTLKICGEGSERRALTNLIEKNKLGKRVELLGFKSDLGPFYSEIDIYVQPSLTEGFGITAAEAMLSGVPTIVSDKGSLPEVAEMGGGVVVKNYDAKNFAEAIKKQAENLDKKLDNSALRKLTDKGKWRSDIISSISKL